MGAPESFIKALQHEPIACGTSSCAGQVECVEVSHPHDRVKTFQVHCLLCGWEDHLRGFEEIGKSWEEAELEAIIDEHLLHLQPICPHDSAPIVFTSLPNPRRRARYRIACYYCGCQAEIDWPPPQTKW
ncbi:hypothetical protein [Candidatus Nitronereus thalassa]|uniref:Uncharacterized protein n=1 Tax=Candidatus Nitronereus thalassa TaxID=3020898 RepID=A0ABU3K6X7_9BACT|nr:hypothetical protein [Candidatus Nitronereus thalassa]MDT7042131.1 hypothetical protein [Candidatus Nitronereus thalassa]